MSDNPFEFALAADKAEAKRVAAAEKKKREHYVTIYVRGCDTTRECYCRNTNGYEHTEYESPWVVDMEGNFERNQGKEQPLEHPFQDGESLEDYENRMLSARVWREGYEFWYENDIPPEHKDYGSYNPYL